MNIATLLADRLLEILNSSVVELVVVLLVSTVTGFALYIRQWFEWRHAAFESRVTISITSIKNGVLNIETFGEQDLKDVVHSPYARRLVNKSAEKTTLENEFLQFGNRDDAWIVYNDIQNTISAIYGAQILVALMRGVVTRERFLFDATWERDSDPRMQKLRIVVVQLSGLEEAFTEAGKIHPRVSAHKTRVTTIGKMYAQYLIGEWPEVKTVNLPPT